MKKIIFTLFFVSMFFSGIIQKGYAEETKTGPSPLKLDIVLVLDNSGSMKKNDPKFLTRDVVTNFLNGLKDNARLGMVIFDQEAILAEALKNVTDPKAKAEFLKRLAGVNYKGQFTNSPDAIERAVYELKTHGRNDAQKVIIFLTDGLIDTGDKNRDIEKEKWLKEDLALESKKAGIRIFGIAFTDMADFLLIQSLAIKTDGEYFRVYEAKDIQGTFENIYNIITKPPVKPEVKPSEMKAAPPSLPLAKPEGKTLDSKLATPTPPLAQEKGIPKPFLLAGTIVILGVITLFLVFKGRSKKELRTAGTTGQPHMPRAELIDINSVISKESIRLAKPNIQIGRDAKRDIAIPENTISDFHATIEYKDGQFYLEDQRSTNGTSLGGKKIEPNKPIRLKSGDTVKFDVFEFRFVLPNEGQAGGTVLSVKSPQESGTVLRPVKPQKNSSPDVNAPADKKPGNQPTEQETQTRLKPGMCPNHPARKAAELCLVCKSAFCKQCMTQKDGKEMCIDCAGKVQ